MVKYHPDTRFLTDYAAGSLPESQALCVAAHLHYCSGCRAKIRELTQLGAEFFLTQEPEAVSDDSFDRLWQNLQKQETSAARQTHPQQESATTPDTTKATKTATNTPKSAQELPQAIEKLTRGNINSLKWRNIGKSFRFSNIPLGEQSRETTLFHIKAGGNVPKHHHGGDEITVVLKGTFSDQEDHYHVGDYIVRTSGESHTPVASQDEDCLCLASLDAPIVMNNWFYRVMAPFFNRPTAG